MKRCDSDILKVSRGLPARRFQGTISGGNFKTLAPSKDPYPFHTRPAIGFRPCRGTKLNLLEVRSEKLPQLRHRRSEGRALSGSGEREPRKGPSILFRKDKEISDKVATWLEPHEHAFHISRSRARINRAKKGVLSYEINGSCFEREKIS